MAIFQLGPFPVQGDYKEFVPIREEANEYQVGDYRLTVKLVVNEIFQTEVPDPYGNPTFLVKTGVVVTSRKIMEEGGSQ